MLRRLKKIREEQALSQRALADRSKVTQATIVHAEQGKNVHPTTLRKLADALCVLPRELIGEEE